MPRCTETSVVLRERRDRSSPSKDRATKTAVPISVAEYARLSQSDDLPDVGENEFLKPIYRADLPDQPTEIAQNVLSRPVDELTTAERDTIDELSERGWNFECVERDGEERVIPYKPLGSEIEVDISSAQS